MRPGRSLLALLAGLLLFDILVNLSGFNPSSPIGSLLLPSIDLLILAAACMGIAQVGEGARIPLRLAVGVLAAFLVACRLGLRFGFDAGTPLGWAVALLLLVAAGGAGFFLSGLLVVGLQPPVSRSMLLLAVSLAVVLQVVSGKRLFAASVIPRLFALANLGHLL